VDITSAADSSDGRVCGLTDHFSPFAIVQLLDSEGPEITTPGPITVEATSAAGATVTFEEPTASDTGSGLATLSCSHASGDTFAIGTTMVTCTATDNAGNTSSETFTILVEDTTAPTVTPIDPITAEATGPAGASVTFTVPTAIDLVSETVTVACAPASGTTFLIGTTTVTCTAEDAAGNVGTADFTITVEDTTAPVFAGVAPITVEATGPDGATVEWAGVTVNDAVDPAPSVTCAVGEETVQSGDTFALGSHEVSCTVTDTSDNSASASFTITVQDTTPPVITVPEAIVVEATSPAGAVVTYANPTAMDVVSGSVSVTCDADTGDTFAIGTTTVTCTAEDTAGNEATATFTVTVNTTLTPTNKNQCKNGGWQRFNNPFFVDQGSCVSFAEKKKK
jgi:hypothetical protein